MSLSGQYWSVVIQWSAVVDRVDSVVADELSLFLSLDVDEVVVVVVDSFHCARNEPLYKLELRGLDLSWICSRPLFNDKLYNKSTTSRTCGV